MIKIKNNKKKKKTKKSKDKKSTIAKIALTATAITICFGGNLDLYWIFQSSDVNIDNKFMITKENYEVFNLFNILFDDIKNINIHSNELPYCWDDEDYKEYCQKNNIIPSNTEIAIRIENKNFKGK